MQFIDGRNIDGFDIASHSLKDYPVNIFHQQLQLEQLLYMQWKWIDTMMSILKYFKPVKDAKDSSQKNLSELSDHCKQLVTTSLTVSQCIFSYH